MVCGAAWGAAERYRVDETAVRGAAGTGRRAAGVGGAGGTGDMVTGAIDAGAIVTAGVCAPRIERVTWTGAMLTRVDITGLIDTVRAPAVVAPRP
jgi:hypothetical protein